MIRARLTVVACAAALAVVAACSAAPTTTGPGNSPSVSAPASGAATGDELTSPVDGVLTHIDAQGLSKVTGFTLRLDDGRQVTFRIGILDNGDQFPPGHLAEHLATSTPLRVYFRLEGQDRVVYRLEDAPSG